MELHTQCHQIWIIYDTEIPHQFQRFRLKFGGGLEFFFFAPSIHTEIHGRAEICVFFFFVF